MGMFSADHLTLQYLTLSSRGIIVTKLTVIQFKIVKKVLNTNLSHDFSLLCSHHWGLSV